MARNELSLGDPIAAKSLVYNAQQICTAVMSQQPRELSACYPLTLGKYALISCNFELSTLALLAHPRPSSGLSYVITVESCRAINKSRCHVAQNLAIRSIKQPRSSPISWVKPPTAAVQAVYLTPPWPSGLLGRQSR